MVTKHQLKLGETEKVSHEVPGIYTIQDEVIRVINPLGGTRKISGSGSTGAVKISLPVLKVPAMLIFEVDIYSSPAFAQYKLFISGYIYAGGWAYTSVRTIGSTLQSDFKVSFGDDGVNSCVWIGEETDTWGNLTISVDNLIAHFGTAIDGRWAKGWNIDVGNIVGTVDIARQNNFPWSDFNKTKNKPTTLAGYGITDGIPKEHQINGTRLTADITGTFNFDWNAFSQFVLTPTGAVTLTESNVPTGRKVLSGVFVASAETVTFPANWKPRANNDPLSDTQDTHFTAESYPDYVLYTLENIPV